MNPLTTTPATNPTEPHHGSVATGAATEAVDSTRDTTAGGFGTVGSSASAHPGHAAKSTDKQQGADRPEDAPTGEQKSAIDNVKKEGEKAMGEAPASKSKQSRGFSVADDGGQKVLRTEQEREELAEKGELPKDPNDNSGEPMKMHDGNEDKARAERKASVQEGGGEHGKVKGTGEQPARGEGHPQDSRQGPGGADGGSR
ncbi:hypothetical protein EJ06DRAFT_142062 [Trichodelitschia bisporula]|uniref:Uncharacterized protein n=1 Tax=Trichodelitschia bisporula TaxID=703511 RepID=A0A6G1HPP1_9PEZI|nr:hypothetical protein EJ06DRAFT_142062 [Trichodelitschia bisporula]